MRPPFTVKIWAHNSIAAQRTKDLKSRYNSAGILLNENNDRFLIINPKFAQSQKICGRDSSKLRSTFHKLPKDLDQWIVITYQKVLIFSKTQFLSLLSWILRQFWSFFFESHRLSQNPRKKWQKLSFIQNQNFLICNSCSLVQIFWNFGKSRSQLRDSLDTKL